MVTTRINDVDVVVRARGTPAEGPVWDRRRRVLWWVDITGRTVHAFDAFTATDTATTLDTMVAAVAPRRDKEGLVAAVRDGFAFLDPHTAALDPIHTLEPTDPPVRMNDGKCDPRGRFWAGTMGLLGEDGAGALHRLDPDGRVHTMLIGLGVSNGMDWSDDQLTMYYIDSHAGGVDVFDYDADSGAISSRRRLVDIPRSDGVADGMTLDADGRLWVAIHRGGCVRRFSPAGDLLAVIELPVGQVTSCAFGGDELSDLYITTSAARLTPAELEAKPLAGSLFVCRPKAKGRPANTYAG